MLLPLKLKRAKLPSVPLLRYDPPIAAVCDLVAQLLYCTPLALSCTVVVPTIKPSRATLESVASGFFVPVTVIAILWAPLGNPLKRTCWAHSVLELYRSKLPLFTPRLRRKQFPFQVLYA